MLSILANIAYADSHTAAAWKLVHNVEDIILFPLITLLTAIALVVFVWGVFQYVAGAESEDARSTGKRHMLWGIIGLVVMTSAFAIISIFTRTFGIDVPTE